jgi:hypothetical protein
METRNERTRQSGATSSDSMGALLLISASIGGVSLLVGIINTFLYLGVANKPLQPFVQLTNGNAVAIKGMAENERDPEAIKSFVANTLGSMFSWTGYLPPQSVQEANNPKPDLGVGVPRKGKSGSESGEVRVPTIAWQSSFALSKDFQNPFLQQVAEMAQEFIAMKGSSTNPQSLLTIEHLGTPVKVEAGAWKVSMIATLKIIQQGKLVKQVPFNKTVFVRAVTVPTVPPGIIAKNGERAIAELNAQIRAAGLEIYALRDYVPEDFRPIQSAAPIPTSPKP